MRPSRAGAIDPRAAVASERLGDGVTVGPFAVIGPHVELEAGCLVAAHAVVEGRTCVGARTTIGHHAVIGAPPQIRGVGAAEAGELVIGADNQLRELCTVHCGSPGGRTELGDGNMLMAYSHVAHDCTIGSGVELANGVQLAGHVAVGDHAVLGGLAALHQFVRVGAHALIAGGAMVAQDVPPFCRAAGDRARVYGLNALGLRRRGFDADERRALARALRWLYRAPLLRQGIAQVASDPALTRFASVARLLEFVRGEDGGGTAGGRRGLCRSALGGGGGGGGGDDDETGERAALGEAPRDGRQPA